MEINLSILGSGRIIKYFSTESLLWRLVGHLEPEEIRNLLYSEQFHDLKYDLPNGKQASTFFEIAPDKQHIAYDLDRISRLEIKPKNKSRSKIFFNEIISDELLFPLYNYKVEDNLKDNDDGLIIMENDIGNFGKCKLNTDVFELDKLSFDIKKLETLPKHIVLKIHYDGHELEFKKRDSLFKGNVVVSKSFH